MRRLRPCLLLLALAALPGCIAVTEVRPGYAYRAPPVPYYAPRPHVARPYYGPRRYYAPRGHYGPPPYRYRHRPGRPYWR